MGNLSSASLVANHSRRNVRLFFMEKALALDAFIASQPGGEAALPGDKKFSFRPNVQCVRVLASQTQHVPWDARRFLSVFVEDEDDEGVCAKQIMHNMASKKMAARLHGPALPPFLFCRDEVKRGYTVLCDHLPGSRSQDAC